MVRARVLRATLDSSQQEQLTTQAALASFPRYRAVASDTISLPDLQKVLNPGEAYYRMTIVGDRVYAMILTSSTAHAVELKVTAKQLDEQVAALRDTISKVEGGKRTTLSLRRGASRTSSTMNCSARSGPPFPPSSI